MLKSTKVKLELLTSIDKILFIEQNIRGGLSYIAQRYCKAGHHTTADDGRDFFLEMLLIDGKYVLIIHFKNEKYVFSLF
jgi:hypothetical protein